MFSPPTLPKTVFYWFLYLSSSGFRPKAVKCIILRRVLYSYYSISMAFFPPFPICLDFARFYGCLFFKIQLRTLSTTPKTIGNKLYPTFVLLPTITAYITVSYWFKDLIYRQKAASGQKHALFFYVFPLYHRACHRGITGMYQLDLCVLLLFIHYSLTRIFLKRYTGISDFPHQIPHLAILPLMP